MENGIGKEMEFGKWTLEIGMAPIGFRSRRDVAKLKNGGIS